MESHWLEVQRDGVVWPDDSLAVVRGWIKGQKHRLALICIISRGHQFLRAVSFALLLLNFFSALTK
jgi:hypothetical protein